MRGEASRRFDGVAGEPRNSYKGISKILSPSLCLSSCTTLISPGTGPRKEAACNPPVLEDRQPETLNKTERKKRKKREKKTRGRLDDLN